MDKRDPCPVQVGSQGASPGGSGLGLFLSLSWAMRDMTIKLGYNDLNLLSVYWLHPEPQATRDTCGLESSSASGVSGSWLPYLTQGKEGLSSGEGPVGLPRMSQRVGGSWVASSGWGLSLGSAFA